MKQIFEALYHLLLFKTYTVFPRLLEIGYGILAWIAIAILIWANLIM